VNKWKKAERLPFARTASFLPDSLGAYRAQVERPEAAFGTSAMRIVGVRECFEIRF
jgi:hypothetical protein